MGRKTKVIFAGAYGIHSHGDDAALVVMVELLRKKIGDFEGVVISRHAEEDFYSRYGLRTVANLEHASREESIGKWFRGFNLADDRSDLHELYSEIASSDLLVLGAGNALVDYTIDILRGPVPAFVLLSMMAKMTGTPVMWYGISIGPLSTSYGRDLSRFAANYLADVITVRDRRSISEMRKLDYEGSLVLLPDPVLGIRPPSIGYANAIEAWRRAHESGRSVIAVSTRAVPAICGIGNENYMAGMAKVCDLLIERLDVNVLFIPQCTYTLGGQLDDDRIVADNIIKTMKNRERAFSVDKHLDVYECLSLYEGAIAAICTRLHGNVFAALEGVPVIALSYNPKVSSFMEWLGMEDMAIDMKAFDPETVAELVERVIYRRDDLIRLISERIADGAKEIYQYIDLALDAMKKKQFFTRG